MGPPREGIVRLRSQEITMGLPAWNAHPGAGACKTRQGNSHTLRLPMSHSHNISAASFGLIEALVRDFEQLLGC